MVAQKVQDIASREIAQCELKLSRLERGMADKAYAYRENYQRFLVNHAEHNDAMRESDEALCAAIRDILELGRRQEAWRTVRDHCADVDMQRGGVQMHPDDLVRALAKQAYEDATAQLDPQSGDARSSQSAAEKQPQGEGSACGSKEIRGIIKKALGDNGDLLTPGDEDDVLKARQQLCCELCRADY
ncbi:hypothetical protein MAPG_07596 [Magnaporthiopsis poae ATCC 64411]|uniref:Uncharacterized protein n=1 Tax=Magnaporthiopsis poae (strain ATCC 64411 / 73-15) TaxID=644358 RepID=A0A0C4E535_MAGP6|nr:hypothetical protein MAPG_07596 [Magnaporthiopsis poae ATCC 64411]